MSSAVLKIVGHMANVKVDMEKVAWFCYFYTRSVKWCYREVVELVDVFSVLMVPSCCMWNLQELHPMQQCILSLSFDIVSIILETGPVSASTYISLYWFVFFCYNSTQNSNVEGKTISAFLCVQLCEKSDRRGHISILKNLPQCGRRLVASRTDVDHLLPPCENLEIWCCNFSFRLRLIVWSECPKSC